MAHLPPPSASRHGPRRHPGALALTAGLAALLAGTLPAFAQPPEDPQAEPAAQPPASTQPGSPDPTGATTPPPTTQPGTILPLTPVLPESDDGRVDDLIQGLERTVRPTTPPTTPARAAEDARRSAAQGLPAGVRGVVRPAASARRTHPEGTFLVSRHGRLVRSPAGEPTFVFDTDPDGRQDPPMTLMPSQNLTRMEAVYATRGDTATFSVSGQVFLYRGRNYLLPTLVIPERPRTELFPNQ